MCMYIRPLISSERDLYCHICEIHNFWESQSESLLLSMATGTARLENNHGIVDPMFTVSVGRSRSHHAIAIASSV